MYVLYVGSDKNDKSRPCPGSEECLTLARRIADQVSVQDCDVLRKKQTLPAWLNGTPILVNRNDPVPLRGTDAIEALSKLVASSPPSGSSGKIDSVSLETEQAAMRQPSAPTTTAEAANASSSSPAESLDDNFKMDADPSKMPQGKVTEADLQKAMAERNATGGGGGA